MEMTTIKSLAEQQHVTYQAIWKLVVKYEKELNGHIVTKSKVRYLDDYAVDFIIQKRRDHPMVAITDDQSAIIESQKAEIDALKDKIFDLQKQLIDSGKEVTRLTTELKDAPVKMLEYQLRNEHLLEDKTRLQTEIDQLRQETIDQKVELQTVKAEAESYHKSIFGFYRKKR